MAAPVSRSARCWPRRSRRLWGVYSGFELGEATPIPGKEEYLDSEKYQLKAWDWDRPGNIRELVTRLNQIRRENPALWRFTNLEFLTALDPNVIVYCKMSEAQDNALVVAVNLDPHQAHGCNFEVPLWRFGLADHATIAAEDLSERGALFLGREDPARLARSGAQSVCDLAAGFAGTSGLTRGGAARVGGDCRDNASWLGEQRAGH